MAAVANLNLSVANVALPSIGFAFDASQVQLNLVAVAYSMGLAASVLWFGALGDRHGRRMMLVLGTLLAIPASIIAGFAPNIYILIGARILGGLAAGMAYPTTLALIAAMWSGPKKNQIHSTLVRYRCGYRSIRAGYSRISSYFKTVGFCFFNNFTTCSYSSCYGVEIHSCPYQRDQGSG